MALVDALRQAIRPLLATVSGPRAAAYANAALTLQAVGMQTGGVSARSIHEAGLRGDREGAAAALGVQYVYSGLFLAVGLGAAREIAAVLGPEYLPAWPAIALASIYAWLLTLAQSLQYAVLSRLGPGDTWRPFTLHATALAAALAAFPIARPGDPLGDTLAILALAAAAMAGLSLALASWARSKGLDTRPRLLAQSLGYGLAGALAAHTLPLAAPDGGGLPEALAALALRGGVAGLVYAALMLAFSGEARLLARRALARLHAYRLARKASSSPRTVS